MRRGGGSRERASCKVEATGRGREEGEGEVEKGRLKGGSRMEGQGAGRLERREGRRVGIRSEMRERWRME